MHTNSFTVLGSLDFLRGALETRRERTVFVQCPRSRQRLKARFARKKRRSQRLIHLDVVAGALGIS